MEKIKLDDFIDFHFISGIDFSNDGKNACFVVHKANREQNDYDSNLWLYQTDTNHYFQLTALNKERSFTWLNDNQHLVFAGLRDPKDKERRESGEDFTVFYRININGGEATKYFEVGLAVSQIKQIDDQNFLFLANYNPARPELTNLDDKERANILKQRKQDKDYEVLEEIPFWSNGGGFISGNRTRIYHYNLETNTWRGLTNEKLNVSSLTLNKDCNQALVIGQEYEGKRELQNTLYLLDLETEELKVLSEVEGFSFYYSEFMNENQVICLGNGRQNYGLNENPRFYLVDINTGVQTEITPDLDLSIGSSVGSDCRFGRSPAIAMANDQLYFTSTEGVHSYLNSIDSKGNITKHTTKTGSVDCFAVNGDQILLVRLSKDRLQEVYQLSQGSETQITNFNDWFTNNRSIVDPIPVTYQVNQDIEIDGWVLPPVDYDPDQSYPAILNIHGGPKTVYGEVYYHEMQFWANEGYFVLFCNPRGSDGKGNHFADIRGKYGTIDYDDLMGFLDTVLAQYPSIDQERLGVTGGSYGGFMTNWIIGHTDRFKAAVSQRSISNWISMGNTTDIGYYFTPDQIDSTPWQDVDKLWDSSPLKYADRVTTPTLFIHAEQDYRCWVVEGLQMFTALKYHGVESRLCMFRGENHELSRSGKPEHRIRRLQEIKDWFQRFLK